MNKGLKGRVVRTSEGGLEVRSVLVLRCTCIRQRWIRVDGHISRHALSAAAKPVRDRHVGRGDAREQRHVRGLRLVRVPLHARRLAAFAVDGHDQAPAVVPCTCRPPSPCGVSPCTAGWRAGCSGTTRCACAGPSNRRSRRTRTGRRGRAASRGTRRAACRVPRPVGA